MSASAPARLFQSGTTLIGRFDAMACPCEVLMDSSDERAARDLLRRAETETRRIETKFSRYVSGNITDRINSAQGAAVHVDDETADLLDFAAQCHELSDGLFDITSGILRKAWRFDGSDRVPTESVVAALRMLVGWEKVVWKRPLLELPAGMEIDFGGIGKEYAVDRVLRLLQRQLDIGLLINFGGDIAAGPRKNGEPWSVGVESVEEQGQAVKIIHVMKGALATSGDARKFLLKEGKRYGHILDPRTGFPVENAPRSVTVAAGTCTEAGFLSTLAMLRGPTAEDFLKEAAERSWCFR